MKWNKYKRFNECIEEALDTYTSKLSDSDIDNMDELEDELTQKIQNEDYEEKWVSGSELNQYNRSHNYQYDDKKDPQLFEGVIVVLVSNGKNLVIDGNHRCNTIQEHYPNTQVCVLEIFVSEIPV